MDRNNLFSNPGSTTLTVALRKESVDRNYIIKITGTAPRRSLSARRAWIEIRDDEKVQAGDFWSLSARRAWIEILMKCQVKKYSGSLSARRAWIEIGLSDGD